ncbi:hypothetical protein LguiA_024239 [Lonicera macranthoides]
MGKIGGSSWLNVVKKAFRSPTKDNTKRSSRRREEHEHEHEHEEEKARGKRRWIFKKSSQQETTIQHNEAKNITTADITSASTTAGTSATKPPVEATNANQSRAIAIAEAAVASAQAAVKVIRLTRPSIFVRDYAAIAVQTAFRGYLARKALRALKGVVKLQALVRGHNVRKRAKMTLRCMQALLRVQARVRDQRKRLSYEGSMDSATFSEPNHLRGSYLANRKSISRDGSSITDEWDSHPNSVEEIRKEAVLKHENTLARAFCHQMWRSGKDQFLANQQQEAKLIWYDQATAKQWEMMGRNSCDHIDPIKTVEVDTAQTYSYSALNFQRSQKAYHHYQQEPHSQSVSSPLSRTQQNLSIHSSSTPSLIKTKPLKMHSASPRCVREDRDLLTAQTPTLGSTYYHGMDASGNAGASSVPNYMAATASAKARVRSQSAPRQRPTTPEREKLFLSKKRLSFPVPDPNNGVAMSDVDSYYNLKSPNCKAVQMNRMGTYGNEVKNPGQW